MRDHQLNFDAIISAVTAAGLALRGAFQPTDADAVPALTSGASCSTLVLVGNAGAHMWQHFAPCLKSLPQTDPLDAWSEATVGALARELGAEPLMPFGGPPWHPFIRWAQRAEPVFPSPLGPLIHPRYGLWHAYRGALAFAERIDLPAPEQGVSPCDSCAERPCLSACPVDAFDDTGYDVPVCIAHMQTDAGSECRDHGCQARRACPVGADFRYEPAQAAFHMNAFFRAQVSRRRRD